MSLSGLRQFWSVRINPYHIVATAGVSDNRATSAP